MWNIAVGPPRRAVFLDRDGILNRAWDRQGRALSPRLLEDFVLLPDVLKACTLLKQHGFMLVVFTWLSTDDRETPSPATLAAMNDILVKRLPVDRIEWCRGEASARSVLHRIAVEWDIDLSASYFVGERCRAISAGSACPASNLADAARWIVARVRESNNAPFLPEFRDREATFPAPRS